MPVFCPDHFIFLHPDIRTQRGPRFKAFGPGQWQLVASFSPSRRAAGLQDVYLLTASCHLRTDIAGLPHCSPLIYFDSFQPHRGTVASKNTKKAQILPVEPKFSYYPCVITVIDQSFGFWFSHALQCVKIELVKNKESNSFKTFFLSRFLVKPSSKNKMARRNKLDTFSCIDGLYRLVCNVHIALVCSGEGAECETELSSPLVSS